MSSKRKVIVIGGGAAGLAAALKLAANDYTVTIVEKSGRLGGRLSLDADPHPQLLWGWYASTKALLLRLDTINQLSSAPAAVLTLLFTDGRLARVPRPLLPRALRLVSGLARFSGLPTADRWRFLNRLEQRWERGELAPPDLDSRTAADWLGEMGQSQQAIEEAWTPLCRFLIGERPTLASAASFMDMLRRWLSSRESSAIRIVQPDLHALLVQPATEHLRQLGVAIRQEAVEQLRCDAQRVIGATLRGGEELTADWYIATISATSLRPLLPERAVTRFSYFQQLAQLSMTPVVTVSLTLAGSYRRPEIRMLTGRPFHWMVLEPERHTQRTRVSLRVVGEASLLGEPDEKLRQLAGDDVTRAVGSRSDGAGGTVYRDVEGFLSLRPGTAALRPLAQSPFSNFLLAGDWTDTGLPPNLESAVLSGERCAAAIMTKT
jgi:uncharacterized protein with NAD-binding domain and iron-sulfur cluster